MEDRGIHLNVGQFTEKFGLNIMTGKANLNKEIKGVYICDLLSWVMSHAKTGDIWITVLTNLNVVAVAALTDVACIIVPEGLSVEEATLKRAEAEGVVILGTDMDSYSICKRAVEAGI